MKIKAAIVGLMVALSMLTAVTLTAAAQPIAGVIDYSDPFSNMWVVGAFIVALLGAILIFFGMVQKSESQKRYTYGFICLILAGGLIAVAMYVPAETPALPPGTVNPTATTYDVILGNCNNTTAGRDYNTYFVWGDVEVNMTADLIANGTGALTFNVTISRTGGAVTDKVRCSVTASDMTIFAKQSGDYRVTWTADNFATVTGSNALPISFPADSEVSAHWATCSVYLSNAAMSDLADDGAAGTSFSFVFTSDMAGTIATVPVTVNLNYWV